jgi:two-component system, cell cycle response regulator
MGLAVVAAIWAEALLGLGGLAVTDFFARWMHDAVYVLAALACLAGAVANGPRRIAWAALGVGLVCNAIGDTIYSLAPNLDLVPVPSVSDPFWLALYPCVYVALLALTRERAAHTLLATRLDGLVCGLAAASVLACVTMSAAIQGAAGTPFWEEATNLAYPIADLILLGGVVSAVALGGWRVDRMWAVLAGAILAWEIADLIYLSGVDGTIGAIADALVVTGAIGMTSAIGIRRGARARRPPAAGRGLFVPVCFGVVALAVLAIGAPTDVNVVALGLAAAAIGLLLLRMGLALKENQSLLGASRVEATTDALTGLGNRRKLALDLDRVLEECDTSPHALVMLDLNGFKSYNDSYGHGAGDALLVGLGLALDHAVSGWGEAYRMGGDEFCVLAPLPLELDELSAVCAEALYARGDGFEITAAHGAVALPDEGREASSVLVLADTRMYRHKNGGRLPAANQSAGVLMAVLEERAPGLASHVRSVCQLACATAVELGVGDGQLEAIRHAASLHDIGKMAIPESILDKPGALSDAEWALMRRHTEIGERILTAAPALESSARLVRSTHERVDGGGYPDQLAGDDIPLGSRVIFVADAFDAMVSKRPYGPTMSSEEALAELRRCAGVQFDAAVVEAFARVLERAAVPVGVE